MCEKDADDDRYINYVVIQFLDKAIIWNDFMDSF